MMIRQAKKTFILGRFFKITGSLILCFIAFLYLTPLLWATDATFRPQIEIFNIPPQIVQHGFASFASYTLNNIAEAFIKWNVALAFLNTIFDACGGIVLAILVSSMCAYAFSYMKFPFKRALFIIAIIPMMLPMTAMIVPIYRVYVALGFIDNPLGLIIGYAYSPFYVFLFRQYFVKIPIALMESAKIDGAGNLKILFGIILPLSRPAL
jgi:ABC-type glycerol-3-phosphate transport system permease component